MSFILDALKKSENDRQRQNGPALYEVKLAAPRTQLPLWAICLGVVLVANLAVGMWVLFRGRSHEGSAQAAAPAPTYAAQPAVARVPPVAQPVVPAPVNQAPPPAQAVSAQQPSMQAPAQPGTAAPPQGSTSTYAAGGQAADAAGQSTNPDDYAPAAEANNPSGFHVRRATESGLQLYSDAAANGGLPELRVDMHTYAVRPQDRFVLINMQKAREGDMLPQGVRVESITPDGVVVSHNGSQFLLPK
jgi:general secretion pathway protein B